MEHQHLDDLWKSANKDLPPVVKQNLSENIRNRMKAERNLVMQYYWSSFVYQIILYGLTVHVLVTRWGNMQVMGLALALIGLYLPFTLFQQRRYKSMCTHSPGMTNDYSNEMLVYITAQHKLLTSFYRFKIWYDRLVVPLNLLLITALIFLVYVPGGFSEHLVAASITYLIALGIFIFVLEIENRKRFLEPLQNMRSIVQDFRSLEWENEKCKR